MVYLVAKAAERLKIADAGWTVWQSREDAEAYRGRGDSVFKVDAVWGRDTEHLPGATGWQCLLISAPIISEFPFGQRDVERAFEEQVEPWE